MTGHISIEIPTKRYIKAYIKSKFGDKPVMNRHTTIGSKLCDLLFQKNNTHAGRISKKLTDSVKIYISMRMFKERGCNLNETNLAYFNTFVEDEIKDRFHFLMDFYIQLLPSFKENLVAVRRELGIDEDHWDDDSMRKDYYRYRLEIGKPLLYNKRNAGKNSAYGY